MTSSSFLAALNVRDRRCVLFAPPGDAEMNARQARLTDAGARIERYAQYGVDVPDLEGTFLIIAAIGDDAVAAQLFDRSQRDRFLLCCIDKPAFSSVSMAARATSGPVSVAISTSGAAPRIAKLLRVALQHAMDAQFARFVEELGAFRRELQRAYPGPANSSKRIRAAIEGARGFRADVRFSYPAWFARDSGSPKGPEHS